jgi:hypothetical protein
VETVQAEVISDRFYAAGLNAATAPRFGAFLNSWTQTQFRIGDVNITDPRWGGTAMLLPTLQPWSRVTVATGGMGVDDGAPALSMALEPQRPGQSWSNIVQGSLSGSPFVSGVASPVPAVERVTQWSDADFLVSGPVNDRVGLVAAGGRRELAHVSGSIPAAANDRVLSGFGHVVVRATPRDEFRVIGWAQQVTASTADQAMHVQAVWERREAAHTQWRLFGGYTDHSRDQAAASSVLVDSIASDPISDLFDSGAGTTRRWSFGARVLPASTRLPDMGVDVEGAQVRIPPSDIQQIQEVVDGTPARLWTVRSGAGPDIRHMTTIAAHASERLSAGRLTLDAGIRLERTEGSAEQALRGVSWTTWLPRALLQVRVADTFGLKATTGYRRSVYQLPLSLLAIGDPAAPVADVAVWNGTSSGPLIARVGPGTGGDPTLTQIDPAVKPPITDEGFVSLESRPLRWLQLKAGGIVKREDPLLELVNVGVSPSAYAPVRVPDPIDPSGALASTPPLTVYNRPAGSYGRDRYVLTNRVGDPATFWGTEASVRVVTEPFVLMAEATIWTRVWGPAAAVGFVPTANDQDLLGNGFVDPNSATHARGQLFQDRSHTVKLAGVFRAPWGVRLGAIARYQDGQPFSRLVVVPNLTQGPVAVRAYQNGGTAFTYTGTLDVRLQKLLTAGRSQVALVMDVYNLPNLSNEVAERVVSGPAFRTPTALQPPRTIVLGARMLF